MTEPLSRPATGDIGQEMEGERMNLPEEVRRAWADRCGLPWDESDYRILEPEKFGWPKDFEIFYAGWKSAYMKTQDLVPEAPALPWTGDVHGRRPESCALSEIAPKPCYCGRTTPWGIVPEEDCSANPCPLKIAPSAQWWNAAMTRAAEMCEAQAKNGYDGHGRYYELGANDCAKLLRAQMLPLPTPQPGMEFPPRAESAPSAIAPKLPLRRDLIEKQSKMIQDYFDGNGLSIDMDLTDIKTVLDWALTLEPK